MLVVAVEYRRQVEEALGSILNITEYNAQHHTDKHGNGRNHVPCPQKAVNCVHFQISEPVSSFILTEN